MLKKFRTVIDNETPKSKVYYAEHIISSPRKQKILEFVQSKQQQQDQVAHTAVFKDIQTVMQATKCRKNRPCFLRCASTIAHHHTPKMVLRSVIFSTPKSGKNYTKLDTKCLPTAHLNILRSAICSTAGIFKTQGLEKHKHIDIPPKFASCRDW